MDPVLSHAGVPEVPAAVTVLNTVVKTLAWFLVGLLIYWVNTKISRYALNNGVSADFDWDKEIVVVTGGARGIGGETVKRLAEGGTKVIVIDVMDLTYEKPENVWVYKCDISDYEALQKCAERIRRDVGCPTIIIANAGIFRCQTLLDSTPEDLELTLKVNTLGLLWTTKTFLPHLTATNHGHLLLLSSQTAFHTTALSTLYSATKAAAVSIYEGLHTELRACPSTRAVRVSIVKPSHVETRMFRGIRRVPGMASVGVERVAGEIVGILRGGESVDRWVPGEMGYTVGIRVLPSWGRVLLQDMTVGAFEFMWEKRTEDEEEKKKKKKKKKKEGEKVAE